MKLPSSNLVSFVSQPSIRHLVAQASILLQDAGVSDPQTSARILLETSLGIKHLSALPPSHIPSPDQVQRFSEMLKRRAKNEPVQYIVGEWPFHNIELFVEQPVLVPRPETEASSGSLYLLHITGHSITAGVGRKNYPTLPFQPIRTTEYCRRWLRNRCECGGSGL